MGSIFMAESTSGFVEAIELDIESAPYADLLRVYGYWKDKRGDRLAPARRDIDPADLVEVLPRIMLVDVLDQHQGFRYRLSGTGICDTHGFEPTGKAPLDLRPAALGQLIDRHYRACVQDKLPALHLIKLDMTNSSRAYARLLLPLSEDGQAVTMLMTVDSRDQNCDALRDYFSAADQPR
jgi:hypothetical protein